MEIDELNQGESHTLSKEQNLEGTRPLVGDPTTQRSLDTAEQQRRATAIRMGSLAVAGHHAAGDLEQQFPQAARYIHDTAAGFEHISNLLRDPNLNEVATLIGNLGRKQPAAIVAGVVLIGLGLSWFLKNPSDAAACTAPGATAGESKERAHGIH
jgi:hypothetical protein